MKLYTEEQLHNTVKAIQNYLDHYDEKEAQENIEKHLKALKPIELPSDEDILQAFTKGSQFFIDKYEGAKWMRDKIGGKDEQ